MPEFPPELDALLLERFGLEKDSPKMAGAIELAIKNKTVFLLASGRTADVYEFDKACPFLIRRIKPSKSRLPERVEKEIKTNNLAAEHGYAGKIYLPFFISQMKPPRTEFMYHIFMERVKGVSLDSIMRPPTPLSKKASLSQRKKCVANLIAVVSEIHKLGIIHGDLNIHNILINEDDMSVRLIDFTYYDQLTEFYDNMRLLFYFTADKIVIPEYRDILFHLVRYFKMVDNPKNPKLFESLMVQLNTWWVVYNGSVDLTLERLSHIRKMPALPEEAKAKLVEVEMDIIRLQHMQSGNSQYYTPNEEFERQIYKEIAFCASEILNKME